MLGFVDDRIRGGLHHASVIKVPQRLGIRRRPLPGRFVFSQKQARSMSVYPLAILATLT